MAPAAQPMPVAMRLLALQFNLQPALYADPIWWPPVLKRAHGATALAPRARALLSRWLLREYRLASRLDFDFAPVIKRLWLMPAALLRQLAFETGVLAQRDAIRACIGGRQLQALRQSLGEEAVELALAGPALQLPPAAIEVGALSRRNCEDHGAHLLLASADVVWHALLRRARLVFGALPRPGWPALEERVRASLAADLVARAAVRFPSWRWLFC